MSGVNKVIIIGRLGKDPETKAVGQGSTMTRLVVATSETWMKDGQKQEKTEWHNITAWGKLAEICGKYLSKGRQVYVEGKLQTRSWEDNGQKKYATDIIATAVQFLGTANNETSSYTGASTATNTQSSDMSFNDFGPEPTFNQSEDIPF